jgi:hypothetical protein
LSYGDELDFSRPNETFLREFRSRRNEIQIVYGHLSFGVHQVLEVSPYYATIVRDPVERVVSQYRHLARDLASTFYPLISSGLSMKDFVAGRYTQMTNNHMTRILAGPPIDGGFIDLAPELLERAKSNIRRYFAIVGTCDQLEDAVREFANRFAWRNHRIPTLNAAPEAFNGIDDLTRDVIVEHNRVDIALYDWIKTGGTREAEAVCNQKSGYWSHRNGDGT